MRLGLTYGQVLTGAYSYDAARQVNVQLSPGARAALNFDRDPDTFVSERELVAGLANAQNGTGAIRTAALRVLETRENCLTADAAVFGLEDQRDQLIDRYVTPRVITAGIIGTAATAIGVGIAFALGAFGASVLAAVCFFLLAGAVVVGLVIVIADKIIRDRAPKEATLEARLQQARQESTQVRSQHRAAWEALAGEWANVQRRNALPSPSPAPSRPITLVGIRPNAPANVTG